jgi:hypothetical protein
MEQRIASGRTLMRRRAFPAAIAEYQAAAGLGAPLIDWADRGPVFSNPDVGFVGQAAQK